MWHCLHVQVLPAHLCHDCRHGRGELGVVKGHPGRACRGCSSGPQQDITPKASIRRAGRVGIVEESVMAVRQRPAKAESDPCRHSPLLNRPQRREGGSIKAVDAHRKPGLCKKGAAWLLSSHVQVGRGMRLIMGERGDVSPCHCSANPYSAPANLGPAAGAAAR